MANTPLPSANWSYPTQIRFGIGRISELAGCCGELGIQRPLVVTDAGLAKLSMINGILTSLRDTGMAASLYSGVRGNPVGQNVLDGVDAYRDGGHDGVIAVGGGSAMDAGKVIAMYQGQSGPLFDLGVHAQGGAGMDAAGIAPIIAVPTTAGTGSETGRAGLITEEASETKRIFAHPRMMPGIVIEDPMLCTGLPGDLTSWTGIDALAHCFEALCAPGAHPMADGIAIEGMRLVKEYLPRAVADGSDLEARGYMLAAASMGSTAFQKGLGAIHSLSHTIGALYDTHHGLTNAVYFPYVMDYNRAEISAKMDRLSAYLGLAKPGYGGVLDWVLETRDFYGIPHTVAEMDIDDGNVDRIAAMSAADPTAPTNPVMLDADGARRIFLASLEGRIG
jgi:alcohol dehydrogenase class IV